MVRAQCSEKKALRKGAWSPEEDKQLIAYIKRYGIWNWCEMAKPAGLLRSGKSCRLRWVNYLKPGVKRGNYTREEEETILKMQEMLGNKWSAIAAALPGRTDNEIKNHWHTHLKKNLQERQKIPDSEADQKSSPELPNAPEASSTSDGSRNIPSSTIKSPAIRIIENQNMEAHISSETLGESSSLWGQLPLSAENLYMHNLQEMFVDPAFTIQHTELWSLEEPISTYGFYNDAINDLWFNLPVPADNMAGVKESNVHF